MMTRPLRETLYYRGARDDMIIPLVERVQIGIRKFSL